jgi:predicted regulator of Ras-like GTPase activity (Roadblock/LC7/MglB family)
VCSVVPLRGRAGGSMEVLRGMTDAGIGDYFISDVDQGVDEDDELLSAPVVVPVAAPVAPVARPQPAPHIASVPQPVQAPAQAAPQAGPRPAAASAAARPQTAVRQASREERLVQALDALMEYSQDVQAAALVSLDGFTMASALPDGMQEDRVGAMSAAILGLGERAAAELGRGHLSQVFIEGADGYVLLMAAGDRAVLTALASPDAKLGLVLYDMRETAEQIGAILR